MPTTHYTCEPVINSFFNMGPINARCPLTRHSHTQTHPNWNSNPQVFFTYVPVVNTFFNMAPINGIQWARVVVCMVGCKKQMRVRHFSQSRAALPARVLICLPCQPRRRHATHVTHRDLI